MLHVRVAQQQRVLASQGCAAHIGRRSARDDGGMGACGVAWC